MWPIWSAPQFSRERGPEQNNEDQELTEVAEGAPPRLPRDPSQGPGLRHQQDAEALQGTPGLNPASGEGFKGPCPQGRGPFLLSGRRAGPTMAKPSPARKTCCLRNQHCCLLSLFIMALDFCMPQLHAEMI